NTFFGYPTAHFLTEPHMQQVVAATFAVASDEKSVTLYPRRLNHAVIATCFFSSIAAGAESTPARQPAPHLRLHVAGRQTVGESRGFSLAVEVSNPGTHVLRYVGYRPDSFDPP